MRWIAVLVLLAGSFSPVAAEATAETITRTAVAADDGTTLRLEDGTAFRLAGLLPPQPPLGYVGVWYMAERSREGLSALTLDVPLRLTIIGQDRWGRALGSATLPDGRQLGSVLIAAGLAQVAGLEPTPGRSERLRLEATARAEGRGLWSDTYYSVRTAEALPDELEQMSLGRFVIVEGRVTDAAVVRGRAYLNFGADWRSDFTATLSPDARRRFRAAGLDPRAYAGRRLRLRGWLESFNGPMIEILSPDQIEVLEEQ
ncbi:thermonuclease family protein [Algihabitans albus]|uniref:thermonuclease family protein n=1 Tax=Algihabitans albus TaxID=2164067 RepID=UPI000E5CBA96|nr:thermonuclease family protein [Algihabitans albus]